MNSRQLELQNIIKSLQSKIHALKKENSSQKSEEQLKIDEALSKEKEVIEEKEKTIEFLKEEISKIRKQSQREIKIASAHHEEEQKKSTTHLVKYKNQCEQLEAELDQKTQYYESKLKEKQNQINKILIKYEACQRQKKALLEERQQFNKFYLSSVHKLPQRQETLLWVDKLIEFMTKTQNILAGQLKQKDQMVTQLTKNIKNQIAQVSNDQNKIDAAISIERQKFIEEMQVLIRQAQEDYEEAIRTKQQFWEGYSKLRGREEADLINKLESQLVSISQSHRKEIESIQQTMRSLQKDKKTLIINFQEMKNLYELRDKTSKEEIDVLKQSISQLLDSQQVREKQFQSEIQRLGEKIEQLTTKFYEKLSLPIQQVSQKIKGEIENFQSQFQGFYSDSLLQNQLQTFEKHIVEYLVSLNSSKEQRMYLKQVAEANLKLIDFLKSSQEEKPKQPQKERLKMAYSSVSYMAEASDSRQFKDKENKLNYELATVKKQLEKMKEYCKQLQGKSKVKDQYSTNSKAIELSAQNQLLKERLQLYQRKAGEFPYNQAKIQEKKLARINTSLLEKLVQNSEILMRFTQIEDAFIDKMGDCISSLNTFIINPLQMFDRLASQIETVKIQPDLPNITAKSATLADDLQRKKELFATLITKKNEVQSAIVKSSNQLTKSLRELLSKSIAAKNNKNEQQKHQMQRSKIPQTRQYLEKRMKEVQTQRVKNRQEMLARLKILDQKFKVIEQKTTKKQAISYNKIEDNIVRKIQEFMTAINSKDKLKDMGKITELAFNDIQSKMKECLIENQGLIKEYQFLRNSKR